MNPNQIAALRETLKTLRAIHQYWSDQGNGHLSDLSPYAYLLEDDGTIRDAVADSVNSLEDHFPDEVGQ